MKPILCAAMLAVFPQAAPAAEHGVGAWRTALTRLAEDVRSVHPDPFTHVGRLRFARELRALEDRLHLLTEEQRVVAAMRVVALIGDGHTQLEPTGVEWRRWYPVRIAQFSDGYFVTSAHRSVADLAGAEVLEIADAPVAQVAEAARDLMGSDNAFDRKQRMYAVHNAALMRGLGFANRDGALKVKVRLRNGRTVTRVLAPAPQSEPRFLAADTMYEWIFPSEVNGLGIGSDADWIAAFGPTPSDRFKQPDPSRPLHLSEATRYFRRSLPEHSAYYMQVGQVDDTTLIDFFRDSLAEVDQVRPKRLIIDLRNNFGGDASRARELVHQLVQREERTRGELYVLTGPKVYSAAVNLLDELKDNVELTLVGEPAGAALNSYGDPVARLYPEAGLRLELSTVQHQLSESNDVRSFIPVDVPAPFSFADYVSGRDPAVDPILRGEEMRSIPQIVRADGGAAARIAFRARQAKFASLDWWSPPTEIELRKACDFLLGANRLAEAIEACTLTTEIHPFVWNSWYNLGQAQRAAGLMQERLSSYRCVLELFPTNWNGPALRKAIAASTVPVPLPAGCPVGSP
jgi:hypothetical protein